MKREMWSGCSWRLASQCQESPFYFFSRPRNHIAKSMRIARASGKQALALEPNLKDLKPHDMLASAVSNVDRGSTSIVKVGLEQVRMEISAI